MEIRTDAPPPSPASASPPPTATCLEDLLPYLGRRGGLKLYAFGRVGCAKPSAESVAPCRFLHPRPRQRAVGRACRNWFRYTVPTARSRPMPAPRVARPDRRREAEVAVVHRGQASSSSRRRATGSTGPEGLDAHHVERGRDVDEERGREEAASPLLSTVVALPPRGHLGARGGLPPQFALRWSRNCAGCHWGRAWSSPRGPGRRARSGASARARPRRSDRRGCVHVDALSPRAAALAGVEQALSTSPVDGLERGLRRRRRRPRPSRRVLQADLDEAARRRRCKDAVASVDHAW